MGPILQYSSTAASRHHRGHPKRRNSTRAAASWTATKATVTPTKSVFAVPARHRHPELQCDPPTSELKLKSSTWSRIIKKKVECNEAPQRPCKDDLLRVKVRSNVSGIRPTFSWKRTMDSNQNKQQLENISGSLVIGKSPPFLGDEQEFEHEQQRYENRPEENESGMTKLSLSPNAVAKATPSADTGIDQKSQESKFPLQSSSLKCLQQITEEQNLNTKYTRNFVQSQLSQTPKFSEIASSQKRRYDAKLQLILDNNLGKETSLATSNCSIIANNLKRIAPNKLVVTKKNHHNKIDIYPLVLHGNKFSSITDPNSLDCTGRKIYSSSHKRTRSGNVKRIKVADDSIESSLISDDVGCGEKGKKMMKLTQFAYRETHSIGKAVRKSRAGYNTQNMGLVRLAPDATKTPICPTFLRGTECTDERCLKRHDVPKEQFLPVCLFFQRQGMCFKEDCPFRHVKINPQAVSCPNFLLLGFCEDSKCPMMHMKAPRSSRPQT